jgi:hypothetical protein
VGVRSSAAVLDFSLQLDKTTRSSRSQIEALAQLACKCTADQDDLIAVTNLIVNRIEHEAADARIPSLFIMDALLKTVRPPRVFVNYFARYVPGVVGTTFQRGSPETRKTVENLVASWDKHQIWPADVRHSIQSGLEGDRKSRGDKRSRSPPPREEVNWGRTSDRHDHASPSKRLRRAEQLPPPPPQPPMLAYTMTPFQPPPPQQPPFANKGGWITHQVLTIPHHQHMQLPSPPPPSSHAPPMFVRSQQPVHMMMPMSFPSPPQPFVPQPAPAPASVLLPSAPSDGDLSGLDFNNASILEKLLALSSTLRTTIGSVNGTRDESVIRGLHEDVHLTHVEAREGVTKTFKCQTCGLRQPHQEALSKHLDWHFRLANAESRRARQQSSRGWGVSANDWASSSDATPAKPAPASVDADGDTSMTPASSDSKSSSSSPPAVDDIVFDDSQPTCLICGEALIKTWNDECGWVAKNSTMQAAKATDNADGAPRHIVHRTCIDGEGRMPALESIASLF